MECEREACLVGMSTGSLSDTVTLEIPQGNPSDEMTLKSKERSRSEIQT